MRLAAIDIGTNSLHMIVCQVRPDRSFEVVDREKDMIRIGTGGLDGRRLTDGAIAAAIVTLSKFKRLAQARGVDEIIAAATSAVREAENGGDFVARVQRQLGLRIRVISGTEEARLIHLAATYAVGVSRKPAVVVDIGGGSTEVTIGTSDRLIAARSFKLGVIRLTERFGRKDPLPGRDERRLVRHIRGEIDEFADWLGRQTVERVIGTSGTILSLAAQAAGLGVGDRLRNVTVSAKAIHRLRERLTSLALDARLDLPGLDPRRADLAPAGAVLLDTILDRLGAHDITLCDFALREGLVLDFVRTHGDAITTADRYPDVRRRSVIELAERCRYVAAHAAQVARLALCLFDATRSRHGLGAREREWLEYSALLHDVGTHIGYERHHKHSYYLICHGGLRGFEPLEIQQIALIARYHRQALPKKSHREFMALPRDARRTVGLLAAMLRLAEGLDRSHAAVVSRLRVRGRGGRLFVTLDSSGDADLEAWAAGRHAIPLADLLGVEIAFRTVRRRPRGTRARDRRPRRPSPPASETPAAAQRAAPHGPHAVGAGAKKRRRAATK